MNFRLFFESHIFQLPPKALQLVDVIRSECQRLTELYYQDKSKVPAETFLGELPDPFLKDKKIKIYALVIEEFLKRYPAGGQGNAGVLNGQPLVNYSIPIIGDDTIYHELVHIYDPKFRLGLSKGKKLNGEQDNTTPHEIDARISGNIEDVNYRLKQLPIEKRKEAITELIQWLRKPDFEAESLVQPFVLRGMSIYYLHQNPKTWRMFLSRLWNDIVKKWQT